MNRYDPSVAKLCFERYAEVLSAATVLILASYAYRHSWFQVEDILHFNDWRQLGPWAALQVPIDAYRLPLHQLCSGLFYQVFGLHFGSAELLLTALLGVDIWAMNRVLKKLGVARLWRAWAILFLSTNVYYLDLLTWWSAALHRLPFIGLSLWACSTWLDFRGGRRPAYLGLSLLAFFLALGFYAKAILIPGLLVLLELTLKRLDRQAQRPVLLPLLALLGLDLLDIAASLYWPVSAGLHIVISTATPRIVWVAVQHSIAAFLPWTAHLTQMPRTMAEALSIFADSMIGCTRSCQGLFALLVLAAGSLLARRKPATAPALQAALVWLVVNAILISISVQIGRFGGGPVLLDRYYFEVIPGTLIFLALAVQACCPEPGGIRPVWLLGVGLFALILAVSAIKVALQEYQRTTYPLYNTTAQVLPQVLRQVSSAPARCFQDQVLPEFFVPKIYGRQLNWSIVLDLLPQPPQLAQRADCQRLKVTPAP